MHINAMFKPNTPQALTSYAHAPSNKLENAKITNPHLLKWVFLETIIAPSNDMTDPQY